MTRCTELVQDSWHMRQHAKYHLLYWVMCHLPPSLPFLLSLGSENKKKEVWGSHSSPPLFFPPHFLFCVNPFFLFKSREQWVGGDGAVALTNLLPQYDSQTGQLSSSQLFHLLIYWLGGHSQSKHHNSTTVMFTREQVQIQKESITYMCGSSSLQKYLREKRE